MRRLLACIAIVLLSNLSEVYAQPKVIYIYDDIGRLVRVVDENNECATYEYDAVGNLLTITRSTNCVQPPTIDSLSQDTAKAGDTTCITISGTNFLGATLTTDNPEVQMSRVRVSETSIEVCLNISPFSSIGTTRIIVNTVGGAAERAFTIDRKTVTITQNTTIGRTDRTFEGTALTIEGPVTVTIDGAHRFHSLTLRNGATVTHSAATGTSRSKLDLTVDTTLTIDGTSKIDVTGRGFLGSNQASNPLGERGMTIGFQAGASGSAGGSYGGLGGVSGSSFTNPVYGDFTNPNEVGSGGGNVLNSGSGGNGGGLIRIVAQTLQLDGSIIANGQNGQGTRTSGGSGGGIRIDVATLQGTGSISARGGDGAPTDTQPAVATSGGGGGRVAIDYQNAAGFNFGNVAAQGGVGTSGPNGGAGTVYLQGPARESGELIIDNSNLGVVSLSTPIPNPSSGTISLTHLRVRRAGRTRIDSILDVTGTLEMNASAEIVSSARIIADMISFTNNSVFSHLPTTATSTFKVDLSANNFTIDSTSRIDVTGRGFLGSNQPSNPLGERGMTVGFQPGSEGSSGGSYGGLGGTSGFSNARTNPAYGDFRNPNDVGSGGGNVLNSGSGGNGGGLIRIVAQTLELDGSIIANGQNGQGTRTGGGSGGGVRIDVGTLQGGGSISARGGNGAPTDSFPAVATSGGGGGRVAIHYQNAVGFNFDSVAATGGLGNAGPNGGAGTVYLQGPGRESGELIIDNNNLGVVSLSTPIPNPSNGTISLMHLRVRRGSRARVDSFLNLTGTLDVASSAEIVFTNRTVAATINLTNNSLITHLPTTAMAFFKVDLSADNLTIDATSKIDVTGRGFLGGGISGNPFGLDGMTVGFQRGSQGGSGGSYGGLGGAGTPNPVYGDFSDPNDVGSGGGSGFNVPSGNGGGLVRLVVGNMQLDGTILGNGESGSATQSTSAGGSGGGIRIDVGTLMGVGQVTANGGNAPKGGSGGGGRVAIYYQDATGFDFTKVSAFGGTGGQNGQDGTVHLQQQTFVMQAPPGG